MSNHTPGPWAVGNTDPLIFGRKQGNGTEPLGFVYGPSFAENSDYGRTALANARLIAAAPDLLEALRDTLDFVERHSNRWDGVNGKHPFTVVEAARATIAKATGEQS